MNWKAFTVCLVMITSPGISNAIIVRGDVPPDSVLAESHEYPEVISLLGGRAVGTLIDEQWILTAAHVGQLIADGGTDAKSVEVSGSLNRIGEVVLHPGWRSQSLGGIHVVDLALLRLDEPVSGAKPAPMYRGSDELGATVLLLGWGRTGDGVNHELVRDGRFRRGENVIDEIFPRLRFRFDEPNSPDAASLEAVSGPGDSGGPAFIVVGGRRVLAGVSSFQQDEVAPGIYGVMENYERVSAHVDWIDRTINPCRDRA